MRTMKKQFTLSIAAVLTASYLYTPNAIAEQNAQSKPLEVIVVTGRQAKNDLDIPSNIKVIDSSDIEASGATTLEDVLRGQSGIQVSDTNSGAVFSIRGFNGGQAANNTLILIDGRRLNNIDIAAPAISAIPLNRIERIEVLSGSAGVLYGDQAVGGVINIITKSPTDAGGSVYLAGGSFDSQEVRADYSNRINADWSYYLTANHQKSDSYRRHNASETGSILGRLQYENGDTRFFAESSYYDSDREYAGSLTKEQLKQDPRQSNSTTDYGHQISKVYRLGYSQAINKAWAFDSELNFNDSNTNGSSFGSSATNSRELLRFTPKLIANYKTDSGNLNLLFGSDLSLGKSEFIGGFTNGRSNTQKLVSLYTQATVPLTKELDYIVGGRYSDITDEIKDPNTFAQGADLDNDAHAVEFGLNYRPNTNNRLYVRAEDNFRFAKVDEQAYSNANGLKPQTGRSYEAGWDFSSQKQSLKISLYQLELEDEIVFDPSAEKPYPDARWNGANVNAEASKRLGFDADWNLQLFEKLNVGAEYHYIDSEFTEGTNKGKELPWIAKNTGRVFSTYDLTDSLQLFTEANYVGKRFLEGDNANTGEKLDSYALLNTAINYRKNNWLASLRLDNLLDKEYVSAGYSYGAFYPGEGRSWKLSLQYQF
ncbi:TonB-dependent receptor [Shewanella sp. 202IG2-18]|uniref:TonB-dependent receptor n=1 Tax=Parashewanella hymeniacidonis TaxID=2807618 RepID=UPI001960C9B3|nr:TonB-dependent receptor [Parashewanella hymeniacidonis]